MGRKTHTGRFYVGDDKRMFESENAAISLALSIALSKGEGETGAVYVREVGTQGAIAMAERVGEHVITRRLR